jgi:sugar phosphate isomerase/epimerase
MIQIAGETGYDFVSLRLEPVTPDEPRFPFTTDRTLVADVVDALDEYGVSLLDVELVRTDPGTQVADFAAFAEVAAEMGARHVVTQVPEPDTERAVELFGEVCDLANSYGITADLEFIPWSPTADLDDAARIVRQAGRPNGGVLVDTLHFARSHSSLSRLAELPREMFNFVQLCDAADQLSNSEEELIRVARSDREPPGEGAIDLGPIVEAIPRVPYALEVPNDAKRKELGDLEYARFVLEATKSFFDALDTDARAATG